MSAVIINAQILGHTRNSTQDDVPSACTFIFESSSEYIEYKIKVTAPQLPYEPIIVRRRYSEFLKLHQDLKEQEANEPSSPGGRRGVGGAEEEDEFMLPSKKLLSVSRNPFKNFNNRLEEEFIEVRKSKLQSYLSTALRAPLSAERVEDWAEPLTSFLSVARLLSPSSSPAHPGGAGERAETGEEEGAYSERRHGDGGGGNNPFGRPGSRGSGNPFGRPGFPPSTNPPPPPPPFAKVKCEAALRLTRCARGHLGRAAAWRKLLSRARPLSVSVAHVSGYASKALNSSLSLSSSYSPYLLISAHDKATGRQVSAARSKTQALSAATSTTDWVWDASERVCLPGVYPDSVLVFTLLDACSIGRDNFLGQAFCELNPAMTNIFTLEPSSSSSSSSTVAAAALVTRGSRQVSSPNPPTSLLSNGANAGGNGGVGGKSLWGGSALPAPPPPPASDMGSGERRGHVLRASSASLVSSVGGGGGGWGGRGGRSPANALELKLSSEQKYAVWLTNPPSAEAFEAWGKANAEAAAAGKDPLGGSNHGARSSLFSRALSGSSVGSGGGLGGSNHGTTLPGTAGGVAGGGAASTAASLPASLDKSRVWEIGEVTASVRWCPLHSFKSGVMYRLVRPYVGMGLGLRRATWAKCFVVLTRQELLQYATEGDAKPFKRCAVGCVEKVAATSCGVVGGESNSAAELPEGVDPWEESVLTVQFDDDGSGGGGGGLTGSGDSGTWHLLCPGGLHGQRLWKRKLNDAVFHALQAQEESSSSSSSPSDGGAAAGSSSSKGVYDLSFLPPSRPRLPTLESNRDSASTSRDTLDLPSNSDGEGDGGGTRPRSSSTGSIADGPSPLSPAAGPGSPFGFRGSIAGAFRESG